MTETDNDLLTCVNCGATFLFQSGERQFFEARGFTPPIRCKACRVLRREKRDALAAAASLSAQVAIGPGSAAHGLRTRTSGW